MSIRLLIYASFVVEIQSTEAYSPLPLVQRGIRNGLSYYETGIRSFLDLSYQQKNPTSYGVRFCVISYLLIGIDKKKGKGGKAPYWEFPFGRPRGRRVLSRFKRRVVR